MLRESRPLTIGLVAVFIAVILQVSLFAKIRIGGVSPEMVMVVVILSALRLRPEQAMVVGFFGGLFLDIGSSFVLGFRALVLTVVAFVASRTRTRFDAGLISIALWVGLVSGVAITLSMILGTLFQQFGFSAGSGLRTIIMVGVVNTMITFLLAPLINRLLTTGRGFL